MPMIDAYIPDGALRPEADPDRARELADQRITDSRADRG
jgi:hypothetical protein